LSSSTGIIYDGVEKGKPGGPGHPDIFANAARGSGKIGLSVILSLAKDLYS
jgi:hypothetical protein